MRHLSTEGRAVTLMGVIFDEFWFLGLGVVEVGCKSVVGQRLKLSGVRWNIPGATGVLSLRCQQASNRCYQIGHQPHNQTPTPITA